SRARHVRLSVHGSRGWHHGARNGEPAMGCARDKGQWHCRWIVDGISHLLWNGQWQVRRKRLRLRKHRDRRRCRRLGEREVVLHSGSRRHERQRKHPRLRIEQDPMKKFVLSLLLLLSGFGAHAATYYVSYGA